MKLNDGKLQIYVSDSATDVIVDVVGYRTNVPATATHTYSYAPDGLRTRKTGPGTNTTFSWDRTSPMPMLLAQNTTGLGTTYYIYGPDGLPVEQINADSSAVFFHHDQQGSTRMLTDTAGNPVATFSYDPYGQLTARTGVADTRLGCTGQYTDPETGSQYLRARYYDPVTGGFLIRDPLLTVTRQAYVYADRVP